MICRNCKHAVILKTPDGIEMGKMLYRTCEVAKAPEERAKYFAGDHKCEWPERAEKK